MSTTDNLVYCINDPDDVTSRPEGVEFVQVNLLDMEDLNAGLEDLVEVSSVTNPSACGYPIYRWQIGRTLEEVAENIVQKFGHWRSSDGRTVGALWKDWVESRKQTNHSDETVLGESEVKPKSQVWFWDYTSESLISGEVKSINWRNQVTVDVNLGSGTIRYPRKSSGEVFPSETAWAMSTMDRVDGLGRNSRRVREAERILNLGTTNHSDETVLGESAATRKDVVGAPAYAIATGSPGSGQDTTFRAVSGIIHSTDGQFCNIQDRHNNLWRCPVWSLSTKEEVIADATHELNRIRQLKDPVPERYLDRAKDLESDLAELQGNPTNHSDNTVLGESYPPNKSVYPELERGTPVVFLESYEGNIPNPPKWTHGTVLWSETSLLNPPSVRVEVQDHPLSSKREVIVPRNEVGHSIDEVAHQMVRYYEGYLRFVKEGTSAQVRVWSQIKFWKGQCSQSSNHSDNTVLGESHEPPEVKWTVIYFAGVFPKCAVATVTNAGKSDDIKQPYTVSEVWMSDGSQSHLVGQVLHLNPSSVYDSLQELTADNLRSLQGTEWWESFSASLTAVRAGSNHSDETVLGESVNTKSPTFRYVAVDGDGIGNKAATPILRDDIETAAAVSKVIKKGQQLIDDWTLLFDGEVYIDGGDNAFIGLDFGDESKLLSRVEELRAKYHALTGFTLSAGVGTTPSHADKCLIVAKARGKNQTVVWSEAVAEEYDAAMRKASDALKMAQEAGLTEDTVGGFTDVTPLPFEEGVPSKEKVATLKAWLSQHSDRYKNEYTVMYHATAKSLRAKIEAKGLLPTSATRRRSYQSQSGFVYLAATPERAKNFGDLGNGGDSDVYAVRVYIRKLLPDTDQLNNQRSVGAEVGNHLAESIVYGGGARVRGAIPAYDVRLLTSTVTEATPPQDSVGEEAWAIDYGDDTIVAPRIYAKVVHGVIVSTYYSSWGNQMYLLKTDSGRTVDISAPRFSLETLVDEACATLEYHLREGNWRSDENAMRDNIRGLKALLDSTSNHSDDTVLGESLKPPGDYTPGQQVWWWSDNHQALISGFFYGYTDDGLGVVTTPTRRPVGGGYTVTNRWMCHTSPRAWALHYTSSQGRVVPQRKAAEELLNSTSNHSDDTVLGESTDPLRAGSIIYRVGFLNSNNVTMEEYRVMWTDGKWVELRKVSGNTISFASKVKVYDALATYSLTQDAALKAFEARYHPTVEEKLKLRPRLLASYHQLRDSVSGTSNHSDETVLGESIIKSGPFLVYDANSRQLP